MSHNHIAASLSSAQNGFDALSFSLQTSDCKCTSKKGSPAEQTAYKTKVSRNGNIAKLQAGYLFPEMLFTKAMAKRALGLSTVEGYSGYGAEQGHTPVTVDLIIVVNLHLCHLYDQELRARLASTFYANLGIEEDDIFVSDGAKSDISRLQVLFGSNVTMAVQDPSYPVTKFNIMHSFTLRYKNGPAFSFIQIWNLFQPFEKFGKIEGATYSAMREVVGFYTQITVDTFTSLGFKMPRTLPGSKLVGCFQWSRHLAVALVPLVKALFGHRNNVLEACRRFKQLYNSDTNQIFHSLKLLNKYFSLRSFKIDSSRYVKIIVVFLDCDF
ncbi:hypothetical protein LXL04_031119 [Taraxacum kok-saghyz]